MAVSDLTICANATKYLYRRCIPIPPLLTTALIDTSYLLIIKFINTVILKIKAFDDEQKIDTNYEYINLHYHIILDWTCTVHKIQLATFAVVPSIDFQLISVSVIIHSCHIHHHSTIINLLRTIAQSDTLSQLVANVLEQTTVLQKIDTNPEDKLQAKKKSITNINSFVKMVLFASSLDGTDTPIDPVNLC